MLELLPDNMLWKISPLSPCRWSRVSQLLCFVVGDNQLVLFQSAACNIGPGDECDGLWDTFNTVAVQLSAVLLVPQACSSADA